jgi:myo-inositol 2-dehydrogenase/D-chiro-inositol 1-dehydrogenase
MTARGRSALVVGGGRMGAMHIGACLRLDGVFQRVAVVDSDPEVRRRWSRQHVTAYADVEDAGAGAFDLAIVAAPTAAHLDIVRTLSALDTRVVIEKPCALDAAGFERLDRIASESRARLYVGLWRRFSPPFQALRELLRSGQLGVPRLALACQWDAAPPGLARSLPALTGGIGLDCGVHETDTARWLGLGGAGRPTWTTPASFPEWVPAGDSDQLVAAGRTDRDVLLSIALSRTAGGVDEIRWKVVGSEGSAEVELGAAGVLRRFDPDGRVTEERFPGDPIAVALERQLLAALGVGDDGCCARPSDVREAALPWIRE